MKEIRNKINSSSILQTCLLYTLDFFDKKTFIQCFYEAQASITDDLWKSVDERKGSSEIDANEENAESIALELQYFREKMKIYEEETEFEKIMTKFRIAKDSFENRNFDDAKKIFKEVEYMEILKEIKRVDNVRREN